MKVGFIGLGNMGKPMAKGLVQAGQSLYVFDLFKEAVLDLGKVGATPCESISEMTENVDVIITMLPNAAIVGGALNDFFTVCKKGQTIIDMSTVATSSTLDFAKKAAALGVNYVDAPVSGGSKGAAEGTLTIMVGGEEGVVESVMPLLKIMGEKIYHVGGVGAGNSMKLVNNMLLGCNMVAVAEALALGVKSGLDLDTMYEIIKVSSGGSYALNAKVPAFIKERNFKPGFAIDLQYKDLELATETGKSQKVPMPLTNLCQQMFEMARALGLGGEDISAVVKVWENLTSVTLDSHRPKS